MSAAATCPCGERIAAPNLDRLNVLLERHYRKCDGTRPAPKPRGATGARVGARRRRK